MFDPYAVLGVPTTAARTEITHAYRRHMRSYHPDTRPPAPDCGAGERLRQIIDAYALLRDPTRRADYDRSAGRARARTGPTQIPVTRVDNIDEQPPLWAGPVRWHPD